MNVPDPKPPGLTLAVQVAFVGKRVLLDPAPPSREAAATFRQALETALTARLRRLPEHLCLTDRHQVCALSSLAIGGDAVFTRACRTLGWWQRIFLPQPREEFLLARGSGGPDFSPVEADEIRQLLASPHIIEERVASTSSDRHERFEDVNLELVRISDVVVCLLPADPTPGKRGGTLDVMELARRMRRPVLELRVDFDGSNQPQLTETWHWNQEPNASCHHRAAFVAPTLPAPLDQIVCDRCELTDAMNYRNTLKSFSSRTSAHRQSRFKLAALIIVVAHVLATALALGAMRTHGGAALRWFLGVELSFLAIGLAYHWWLHHSEAAKEWAMSRLSAEVARSVIPLAGVPRSLRHLLDLPMPDDLGPLLRTLDVLHLAGLRSQPREEWKARRDAYVRERLKKQTYGQLDYYRAKLQTASCRLALARWTFYIGSGGALLATAAKLSMVLHWWHVSDADHDIVATALAFLAVLLPVIAVAGLSLAAAFDLEARTHTYEKMLDFLNTQTPLLETAATENEFATLALQTESRLLAETAIWYARRAFTGVA
ncbi:MAG: hypothetical protein ACKV19_00150 [Verrucomicrobiales bacterium]